MSYAGPVSRGKRAPSPNVTPIGTPGRGTGASARPPAGLLPARTSSEPLAPAVFAAGVAVGTLLGAGIALLLAPRSGEETRHALRRGGRRISRRGHDAWEDLRDELRRAQRRAKRAWARRFESDEDDD